MVFQNCLLCGANTELHRVDSAETDHGPDAVCVDCEAHVTRSRFHEIFDEPDEVGLQSALGMSRHSASHPDLLCMENYYSSPDVDKPLGLNARELVSLVGGLSNPEAAVEALQKACDGDLEHLRWGLASVNTRVARASGRLWREVGSSVGMTTADADKLRRAILTYDRLD